MTAHVVELLAREPGYEEAVRRGVDYLLREQEEDGSWFGRWGVNYVYGTGAALPALAAAGFAPDHPAMRRAVAWLEARQNEDGGFGEDCRSYDGGAEGLAWRGRGRLDAVADGLGAASGSSPPARRLGGGRAGRPPGSASSQRPTATGTRSTSPAPASRATS